jgi:hypothetical protein
VLTVNTLRELFRHLQSWEALFETEGIDEITGTDATTYHLRDVQYLYECRRDLSPRQAQAIQYFLYENMLEKDVAVAMGVSPTNPVAMYATDGLKALCEKASAGLLPRYREEAAA